MLDWSRTVIVWKFYSWQAASFLVLGLERAGIGVTRLPASSVPGLGPMRQKGNPKKFTTISFLKSWGPPSQSTFTPPFRIFFHLLYTSCPGFVIVLGGRNGTGTYTPSSCCNRVLLCRAGQGCQEPSTSGAALNQWWAELVDKHPSVLNPGSSEARAT